MSPSTRYVFDGQSLGYTPWVAAQSYPNKYIALKHPENPFNVTNLPGTTYAERAASLPMRVDSLVATARRCVLVDDGGTYDLESTKGNMTAAQLLAAKGAYASARRAAGFGIIIGFTVAPSVDLTLGEETNRQAVNAALKGDPLAYGYDQIIDLDAVPQLANPNNAAFYYDGVHWTDAATSLVAQELARLNV